MVIVNTRGAGCGWARALRNGISHPANISPKYNIIQRRYLKLIVFKFSALRLQINNGLRVCFILLYGAHANISVDLFC